MSKNSRIIHAMADFKVFTKDENGRWRIESMHSTRKAAEYSAEFIVSRRGVVARVML